MGKAAAPSRGGGCAGRSRGLSSLFTVVPCLSCHTAAPGMNSSTSSSGPELKPQLQPMQAPERELLSEQVCKPVFEPVPRSEPGPQTTSEPGPSGAGQESELQDLWLGSEAGPRVGAGPFTKITSEELSPLGSTVGNVTLAKPESRSVSKPQPLQRPGQARTSSVGGQVSGTSVPMVSPPLDSYKGWLLKWTNYLKGYQRRWFVLGNGLLSYYRNQDEMAHTCRGTINLASAHFDTEDSCGILLCNGTRTYHLKAGSEVDRQQWITVLELAKAKAIRVMKTQSGSPLVPDGHNLSSGIDEEAEENTHVQSVVGVHTVFSLGKGQTSHGYQPAMEYQVAVRLGPSSPIKRLDMKGNTEAEDATDPDRFTEDFEEPWDLLHLGIEGESKAIDLQ
ncbi:hypothetical protein STEG23_023777, partial [Scotinomys teguina]